MAPTDTGKLIRNPVEENKDKITLTDEDKEEIVVIGKDLQDWKERSQLQRDRNLEKWKNNFHAGKSTSQTTGSQGIATEPSRHTKEVNIILMEIKKQLDAEAEKLGLQMRGHSQQLCRVTSKQKFADLNSSLAQFATSSLVRN